MIASGKEEDLKPKQWGGGGLGSGMGGVSKLSSSVVLRLVLGRGR